MGPAAMYAFAALLACLYLTIEAVPTESLGARPLKKLPVHIPDGKINVYTYSATVSAGQKEPAPYVSQMLLDGQVLLKFDSSDANSPFAKYLKFHGMKYSLFNGPEKATESLYQTVTQHFEEPILIVCDEYDKLQGIKMQDNESLWSRNMKKSIASIMQVDLSKFELRENLQPTAFQTIEKTIHGDCQVDYSVYTKDVEGQKLYYIRKVFEPRNCSKYVQYVTDADYSENCKAEAEEDLVTSVERIYELEYLNNNDFILRKVNSQEKLSYLPWLHRSSGIQYIETNQTLELEKAVDETVFNLPIVDFKKIPVTNDVTFDNNISNQTDINVSVDNYFRDKPVNSSDIKRDVKEILLEILDYLKDSHFDEKKVDPKLKYHLERLREAMSYLDAETLHYIYKHFNTDSEKGITSRKIFLKMVPYTGTAAAWSFTEFITKNNKETPEEELLVQMFANLPLHVQNPTEDLARKVVGLGYLSDTVKTIKAAGVLSYSILLHKTYKNIGETVPEFLETQIKNFYDRIKYSATYHSKILYIMALRNVEVGGIYKYLAPIVRGEDIFFVKVDIPKPEKYRLAAMWAVAKSISHDRELTYNLFWPILSNSSEPLPLRVAAYELLVSRNPSLDMNLLMNVHWFMAEEQDEHLFNYHYMTVKNTAESTDPCRKIISEMMRKVLRLTKPRKVLSSVLSRVDVFDYFDTKYGHGKTFKLGTEVDEVSGVPQVGYYEVISTVGRRSRLDNGIYYNIDGLNLNSIMSLTKNFIQQEAGSIMSEESMYEIPDEKVKTLLRQTYGHKLLDKHIHVEFWTVNNGFVTNVQVFFENGLLEYLKGYIDSYKPKNLMDAGEKFNRNWLDLSYSNIYKMVVATDIGVPAFFYNEVPQLSYIKLKPNIFPLKTIIMMKLELDVKFYQDSSYKMKFYNPFADTYHSVQRHVTTEAALPIDATISFNLETHSLKMVLPRMSETKLSVAGIKVESVDQVQVEKDSKDKLPLNCPDCSVIHPVVKSFSDKYNYENVYHSIDTGLDYTHSVFNCENRLTPGIENEEWFRLFNTEHNNVNNLIWPPVVMLLSNKLFNISPYTSTCGRMIKISPSSVYPTSHVEMTWRFNMEKSSNAVQLDVRGSIEAKAASTNETVRYWDIDVHGAFSQFLNDMKLKLTRKTPGEKNLMICLDAQKVYPNFVTGVTAVKHETDTKIDYTMGLSDDDKCVRDDMLVKISMKGELLDEQVEQLKANIKPGSCFRNPSNPLDLDITQRFDWNCLYEAVKATTMRKYSINVMYKKIPHEILAELVVLDDLIRLDNLPYITYKPNHTEQGNVKVFVTYATNNNFANITVVNPFFSYELADIYYGPDNHDDRRNDLVLDNTGFNINFLAKFYNGEIRPCIVHANDLINDLNQTIPVDFKDWTLVSGDHGLMTYAVFVKTVGADKVAVKIYASMHVLEVQPGDTTPIVTIDGIVINDYDKGVLLPSSLSSESYFKLMTINQLLLVETEKYSKVKVYYTPYNVIVLPYIILDRNVDGLCGRMGSMSYVQQTPLVYGSS